LGGEVSGANRIRDRRISIAVQTTGAVFSAFSPDDDQCFRTPAGGVSGRSAAPPFTVTVATNGPLPPPLL
jgi:hypothetical protein